MSKETDRILRELGERQKSTRQAMDEKGAIHAALHSGSATPAEVEVLRREENRLGAQIKEGNDEAGRNRQLAAKLQQLDGLRQVAEKGSYDVPVVVASTGEPSGKTVSHRMGFFERRRHAQRTREVEQEIDKLQK